MCLRAAKFWCLTTSYISTLSEAQINEIKKYVSNGGGLVVVGGERAYNYGNYLNSSLEGILPVISKPSEYKGGRNLVLILDVSPSTQGGSMKEDTRINNTGTHGDILANAIYILQNKNLKDANVGVIAFGSEGYDVSGGFLFMGLPQNQAILKDKISKLTTSEQEKTSLEQGLGIAKDMLAVKDGERDAIIISDGGIKESYDQSLQAAKELKSMGVNLYFIHVHSLAAPNQADPKTKEFYAENLMKELGLENNYKRIDLKERADISFGSTDKSQENQNQQQEDSATYPLYVYSPDHFITKNVNLTRQYHRI